MHAMGIFVSNNAEALKGFADRQDQLAVLRRERPEGADGFFPKLMSLSFGIAGKVCRQTALEDVRYILQEDMPEDIQRHPFYASWLADMARVSSLFCDVEKSEAISLWIGSKRGCRRYHIDNVPRRLLVTYAGKGTEWLPDEAVDRRAYHAGEPNERIVTDMSARRFIDEWDVALFRGGAGGLLHRTPDEALNGASILMRLDNETFGKQAVRRHRRPEHAV